MPLWITARLLLPLLLGQPLAIGDDVSRLSDQLQGDWQGKGPPGAVTMSIIGSSLHFYADERNWYRADFELLADTSPQVLRATITDCSPPTSNIGEIVVGIVEIVDGTLRIGVGDGSLEPPESIDEAGSVYVFQKAGTVAVQPLP